MHVLVKYHLIFFLFSPNLLTPKFWHLWHVPLLPPSLSCTTTYFTQVVHHPCLFICPSNCSSVRRSIHTFQYLPKLNKYHVKIGILTGRPVGGSGQRDHWWQKCFVMVFFQLPQSADKRLTRLKWAFQSYCTAKIDKTIIILISLIKSYDISVDMPWFLQALNSYLLHKRKLNLFLASTKKEIGRWKMEREGEKRLKGGGMMTRRGKKGNKNQRVFAGVQVNVVLKAAQQPDSRMVTMFYKDSFSERNIFQSIAN